MPLPGWEGSPAPCPGPQPSGFAAGRKQTAGPGAPRRPPGPRRPRERPWKAPRPRPRWSCPGARAEPSQPGRAGPPRGEQPPAHAWTGHELTVAAKESKHSGGLTESWGFRLLPSGRNFNTSGLDLGGGIFMIRSKNRFSPDKHRLLVTNLPAVVIHLPLFYLNWATAT